MDKIYRVLLVVALSLIFITGSTARSLELAYLTNYFLIIGGVILFVITILFNKGNINIYTGKLDNLYFIFIFGCILTALVNSDLNSLMTAFKYLSFYLLFILCIPNISKLISPKIITSSFMLSGLFILLVSFSENSPALNTARYSGIFDNPNSFGLFSTTLFSYILFLFISNVIFKYNFKVSVLYLILLIITFYMIIITSSRTSFLAAIFLIFIVIFSYLVIILFEKSILKKHIKPTVIGVFLLTGVLFLVSNTQIITLIQGNIIEKFARNSGDITSSRSDIWNYIIDEASLFGAGSGYVNELGYSAHNTFFEMIESFGVFAGSFYIAFWLIAYVKSFTYLFKNHKSNIHAFFPLISISNFLLLSMMEVLTVHSATILAMLSIGFAFYRPKSN
ncbi:O-antigen ligase family protein [Rossellomorea aquimaris]|uniref:O-antigen ligase-related domain-containing protein n=1 Tax=Rossellomorea aquimaris TaxID=189382 RepID=A0A5D4TTN0_9BACI|nr:O-antigen polymerase [Rossellomorea aquimaris]TYS78555.1 hypothetical protein FZC80_12495 [Rossellomorea aquimaris]